MMMSLVEVCYTFLWRWLTNTVANIVENVQ